MSGETLRPQLQFLHQSSQLPELFVVSDDDEYPSTQQAMQLLYVTASSLSKKLIHYSAVQDAPWKWYEPFDIGKVPAKGGHGTRFVQTASGIAGDHRELVCHYINQNSGARARRHSRFRDDYQPTAKSRRC
jgi:hypothetical protein